MNGLVYTHYAEDTASEDEIEINTSFGRQVRDFTAQVGEQQWRYEYELKDHMGNVRVIFARSESGTAFPVQQNNFYAFSMRIPGLCYQYMNSKFIGENREIIDEHGLNWIYWGKRFLDPQIGRWHSLDPAEQFDSPYVFCENNPVNNVEIDGGHWKSYEQLKNEALMEANVRNARVSAMVNEKLALAEQTASFVDACLALSVANWNSICTEFMYSSFNSLVDQFMASRTSGRRSGEAPQEQKENPDAIPDSNTDSSANPLVEKDSNSSQDSGYNESVFNSPQAKDDTPWYMKPSRKGVVTVGDYLVYWPNGFVTYVSNGSGIAPSTDNKKNLMAYNNTLCYTNWFLPEYNTLKSNITNTLGFTNTSIFLKRNLSIDDHLTLYIHRKCYSDGLKGIDEMKKKGITSQFAFSGVEVRASTFFTVSGNAGIVWNTKGDAKFFKSFGFGAGVVGGLCISSYYGEFEGTDNIDVFMGKTDNIGINGSLLKIEGGYELNYIKDTYDINPEVKTFKGDNLSFGKGIHYGIYYEKSWTSPIEF